MCCFCGFSSWYNAFRCTIYLYIYIQSIYVYIYSVYIFFIYTIYIQMYYICHVLYVVVWTPLSLRSITRGRSSASIALLLKYAVTLIPCRALSALGKKLFAKRCNLHGRHEADALLTFTACTVVSCCTECSLFFDALCGENSKAMLVQSSSPKDVFGWATQISIFESRFYTHWNMTTHSLFYRFIYENVIPHSQS